MVRVFWGGFGGGGLRFVQQKFYVVEKKLLVLRGERSNPLHNRWHQIGRRIIGSESHGRFISTAGFIMAGASASGKNVRQRQHLLRGKGKGDRPRDRNNLSIQIAKLTRHQLIGVAIGF